MILHIYAAFRFIGSHPPPLRPTPLQDSAVLKAPPAATSQPLTNELDFNLVQPGKKIQVKIEPADSPPLSSTYLNLEPPQDPPAGSTDLINLTLSLPVSQFNLDRPLHRAHSSVLSSTTSPSAINLDCPLCKAKSAQSYQSLPPPASNPLFGAMKGTHPSLKEEMTREQWADEKSAFPRHKVGNGFYGIFSD